MKLCSSSRFSTPQAPAGLLGPNPTAIQNQIMVTLCQSVTPETLSVQSLRHRVLFSTKDIACPRL